MATKYFATTGDDGAAGTIGDPYLTPGKAIAEAGAGGQALGRTGTYAISSTLTNWLSGSGPSTYTEFGGYNGEKVTLQATAALTAGLIYPSTNGTQYLKFYDLILDGNGFTVNAAFKLGGTKTVPNSFIWILDCEMYDVYQGLLFDSSNDGLFEDLSIHDINGNSLNHCLYVSGGSSRNIVQNCELYNSPGFAIQNYSGSAGDKPSDNIYRNLHAHHCYSGISIVFGSGNLIANSYIHHCDRTGLEISSGAGSGNMIAFCAAWENRQASSGAQIQNLSGDSTNIIRNTLSFHTDAAKRVINTTSGGTADHNHTASSPTSYWTDPTEGAPDFTLLDNATTQANVIDQGVAVGSVSLDYLGNARSVGAAPDLGPEERTDALPPDAPTISHEVTYTVTTAYGVVEVTLTKGTDDIVKSTIAGTGAAAICVDNTDVTVVRGVS